MTAATNLAHPDPETLAAFAEGKLKRSEIPQLLAHLEECQACMRSLQSANDVQQPAAPRRWPLVAAAAIAVAALLAIPALRMLRRDPMAKLAALVPADNRIIEPRLTGAFAWAPYRGPARLEHDAGDSNRMKLVGMTGELVDNADRAKSPDSEHDAGVGLLLIERPLDAVARLRQAADREPSDAKNWSDLSAALYAAARQLNRPSLYPQALDAADRALHLAPDAREALFNRALIVEALGLTDPARAAWQRYLQIDPSSPWAEEARQHLAKLPAVTSESLFNRDRPRLEAAAAAGDARAVSAFVARYPQQARTWSEFEYLARWADATQRGDDAAAQRALDVPRTIGAALAAFSGESLPRDAVASIEAGDARARAAIAEGHVLYHRGRIAYSKQKPTEAEADLRAAAARFASANDPMTYVARYYAANTRFDQNDVAGARAELLALLAEADAHPQYAALGAHIRWELALCSIFDSDWSGALPLLTASRATFARLGERNYLGFVDALMATTLLSLGRSDESWAARIRAFETLSQEGHGDRLAVSVGGAALMEMRAGRLDAARALLAIEEPIDRQTANQTLVANLFVRRAVLSASMGDGDASSHARQARESASRLTDPQLRAKAEAEADFAAGAACLSNNPRAAQQALSRAIDFFRTSARPAYLPECYLLRARAASQLGARADALRDLDSGIAAMEAHRVEVAGSVTGTGVLDAGPALLQEAVRLRLDSGDVDGAFDAAERTHRELTDSPRVVTIAELQQRLAGSDAAVLTFAVLPHELVAFSVTAAARSVVRTPLPEDVKSQADRALRGEAAASRALYELLIHPSQRTIAGARSLIVIAPQPLDSVPFAALVDPATGQFAVQTWSVAVAPSASALQPSPGSAAKTALAVALPSNDRALPESGSEVADVRALYASGTELSGVAFPAFASAAQRADVVHIASHTSLNSSADEFALNFAGQHVSWRTIATMRLRPSAAVLLASCESLRQLHIPESRSLSLGGGFLAAGAANVIGTLTPIQDSDARELFLDIHRRLARGVSAADALREMQLAAMTAERSNGRPGAWRSVTLLTRRIPQREMKGDGHGTTVDKLYRDLHAHMGEPAERGTVAGMGTPDRSGQRQ
jgi:CHAT domain-containing protein